MQKSEVVDEDNVAGLRIQAVAVFGCQRGKHFECFELRRSQAGDSRFSAGFSSGGVEAQASRVDRNRDVVFGNVKQWRDNVSWWIARSG